MSLPGIKFISSNSLGGGGNVGIGLSAIRGPTGPPGAFGGPQGLFGLQGVQGLIGYSTGTQGLQGLIGSTGSIGLQGNIGMGFVVFANTNSYTGLNTVIATGGNIGQFVLVLGGDLFVYAGTGSGYTGPENSYGYAGDVTDESKLIGTQGNMGLQGLAGTTGVNGSQGLQGLAGTTGVNGSQGLQGLAGTTGVNGLQGSQGLVGSTGSIGSQGFVGSTGTIGLQGLVGSTGSIGLQGLVGPTGPGGGFIQMVQLLDNVQSSSTTLSGQAIIPNWTRQFYSNGGSLMFHTSFSAYASSLGLYTFDFLIDGSVVANTRMYFNSSNVHMAIPSYFNIENASVGFHTGAIRIPSGITVDSGDYCNMSLIEVVGANTIGLTGSIGLQGLVGSTGSIGLQGLVGPIGGSDTQILYNSGGVTSGSDNLTFDGTEITMYDAVVTNTFSLNGQIFYSHGADGFSVNENFDAGNASTTAYHFTSGDPSRDIIFSIAKTSNFTNLFGSYGTPSDNHFVIGSETQGNTSFEIRSGVGIAGSLNLAGGNLYLQVGSDGQLYTPYLQSNTTSNILYFNPSSGLVTYGNFSGLQGPQGLTGSTGLNGTQGYQGPTGSFGPQGIAGPTGVGGALGYYGSFYDTTIQAITIANTGYVMTYNTTLQSNGIHISNGSRINFQNGGVYNLQFSAQFDKTDSGTDTVDVWMRQNGINVPWSNTRLTSVGNNDKMVASWNFMQTVNANDYLELVWMSNDIGFRIYSETGTVSPVRPEIPSVIVTIQQVMNTQLGPQGLTGSIGYQGVQGLIGSIGVQGLEGVTGSIGYQGSAGKNGYSSSLTLYLDTAGGTYSTTSLTGSLIYTPNQSTQTTILTGNQSNTTINIANFLSNGLLPSTIISAGNWDLNLYSFANTSSAVYLYFEAYYVDADGVSNQTVLALGTGTQSVNIGTPQSIYTSSLYIPTTILPDTTKRILLKLFLIFSGNNRNATIEFRDGTLSHVHTNILSPDIAVGKNTQITFNQSGAYTGSSNLTYNYSTNVLNAPNLIASSGSFSNLLLSSGNIMLGGGAGSINQKANSIAIGNSAGQTNQGTGSSTTGYSVAIGNLSGNNNQGYGSVSVGYSSGQTNQGELAVSIGTSSGNISQGLRSVGIGQGAGYQRQGAYSIAMGDSSGQDYQGTESVSIGRNSGLTYQNPYSVAIGSYAGSSYQSTGNVNAGAVAVGSHSGQTLQQYQAVSLGYYAGNNNQGSNSVAIGANAGYNNQASNSIIINASGNQFNATGTGLFINPVRNVNGGNLLSYNTANSEVSYSNLNYSNSVLSAPEIAVSALSVTGTFKFGTPPQIFYPHGANGFSVNEDFDSSNSSTQTAYHFTSGTGTRNIVFDLAVTNQYTTMFGTYGTAASNNFVIGSETGNTSFSFKKGLGIQPINLSGGTTLMSLDNNGNMSLPLGRMNINNNTNATGSATGALIITGGVNVNGESVFNNIVYAPSLNPNFISRGNPGQASPLLLNNYNTVHYYSTTSATGFIDISTTMVENAVYEIEGNCFGASSSNNDMFLYPNYSGSYGSNTFYCVYTQSSGAPSIQYATNNSSAFYFDYVSGSIGFEPCFKIKIYNNRSAKKIKVEMGDTTAIINGQGYWTAGSGFTSTSVTPPVYDTSTIWSNIGRLQFNSSASITFTNWNIWVKRLC